MRRRFLRGIALGCVAVILTGSLAGCGGNSSKAPETAASSAVAVEETAVFEPKLDTEKEVTLDVSGFFGNFEALEQVLNEFNAYYPNVTLSYEQNDGNRLVEYMKNNTYADIVMTKDNNFRYTAEDGSYWKSFYVGDRCADLVEAGVDVSAVDPEYLAGCTYDGKVLMIPFSQKRVGMVVNKTLLEKEGLSVPTNYADFLTTLEALKQAGYTPIQGPESSIYENLVYNMAMTMIGTDSELLDALNAGDESAVEKLTPVFERIKELKDKGYINSDVNAAYPNDNYDGAIMKFFEGNVPFWTCTMENYSGMKKRESKSENFSAEPFAYAFVDVPMGENGVYEFAESWCGFAVNKDSEDYDYAIEFMRFLAQSKQLQTLASVKGVPSITKDKTDERYADMNAQPQVEIHYINKGALISHIKDYLSEDVQEYGTGKLTLEEAVRDYVQRCAETAKEMAENS